MPELVAPIMPDIAGSFRPLARGMAQWAENRRYAQANELGQQKLAQDAASDQQRFELQRQQLANQFKVQQSQIDLNAAHADYFRNYEVPLRQKAAEQIMDYNRQTAQVKFDALERRKELGLDDPKMQTENPVAYAANARRFADEFATAPTSTGINTFITADKRVTDQMKLPLYMSAEYDSTGHLLNRGGATHYPIVDIVEKLQDPQWSNYMKDALVVSGFAKQIPGATHMEGEKTFPVLGFKYGGTEVKEKPTTEIGDIVGQYVKPGAKVDFSRGRNRVGTMIAPTSGAYRGTGELRQGLQQQLDQTDQSTALPEPDLYPSAAPAAAGPPGPQPTETDQLLNQARAALQAGAPLQAIAQRLAAQQIDPNLLFQQRADQGLVQPVSAPGTRFNQTAIA